MYAIPYLVFAKLHQLAIKARRGDRSWRYLAWSSLAGVTAGVMIATGAAFAVMLWLAGLWWFAVIVAGALVAPIAAGFVVRHALVPLGWVRPAFYAALISRPGKDAEAYALCCAGWAFGHAPSGRAEAWIARRRAARVPLGDAEVAVTGLVLAGRGDADTARRLLRSIATLVEDHPAVREVAGEWLAVDAAERGAWSELHQTAGAARWPATPLTFLLEGVAARRVGASTAPSAGELRARWLLAPYRRATRALLADPAPSEPAIGPPTAGTADPVAPIVPLPHAVAAHLTFHADAPCAEGLASTVHAWDAALADGATHGWLTRRALELDAPLGAVDRALREVVATVTDELARVADAHQLGAPPSHGPVGEGLARRLRHGRLDALEAGFTRWAQRRHDGSVRSAIDEWREFIALQAAYDAAVAAGGVELRRLAFPHAWSTGSHMAAWLWNTRNEYALSHAISKWLLAEALAVGDAEAIELGHRNCKLTVPTRLGDVLEHGDPT